MLRGGEGRGLPRSRTRPGHASHHVSYLHEASGDAFVGDVAGVRDPADGHVARAHAAARHRHRGLARVARPVEAGARERLGADPLRQLRRTPARSSRRVRAALDALGARGPPSRRATPSWRRARRRRGAAPRRRALSQAVPPDTLSAGLDRYWRKRAERRRASLAAMQQTVELPRVTAGPGMRPGRRLARDRPQRRPQHLRPRGRHPGARHPGRHAGRRLPLADTIHNTGQAIVWTGHHELAEHYWEQLRDAGLTMAPLEQG